MRERRSGKTVAVQNIRITSKDLEALQKRALTEGIPYQTLITSILHKYIQGRLKEQNL